MDWQELAARIDNAVEGLTKELEAFACAVFGVPVQASAGSGYRIAPRMWSLRAPTGRWTLMAARAGTAAPVPPAPRIGKVVSCPGCLPHMLYKRPDWRALLSPPARRSLRWRPRTQVR